MFTKEKWAKLNKEERSWLAYYNKNKDNWEGWDYSLPDGCSWCPVCENPQMGSGVCSDCLKEADRLYSKII